VKLYFNDIALHETDKVVNAIIPFLSDQKIVLLDGTMGSGKTTLIKHLCKSLAVIDQVNSPTFSIVNTYKTKDLQLIYHFDFYRLNDIEEAFDMGVEEYFYSGNICLIEWAERIEEIIPDRFLKISINVNHEKRNYMLEQF
jgi:tRNA threonylcarbamoyladenosine biosynthesis protein TsaE